VGVEGGIFDGEVTTFVIDGLIAFDYLSEHRPDLTVPFYDVFFHTDPWERFIQKGDELVIGHLRLFHVKGINVNGPSCRRSNGIRED
jgi:hypothetical protein